MKRTLLVLAVIGLCILFAETSFAQTSAQQTVNLAVNAVSRIAITGAPISLTIVAGTEGSDNLTPVTDNSSTYSITHNSNTALRMTASLDQALPAGYTLQVGLTPTAGKGNSLGNVDISNATSTAVDVVTGIPHGADANRPILYTFSALASAGTLASTQRIVTITLTN